jgi:hypothetical protein
MENSWPECWGFSQFFQLPDDAPHLNIVWHFFRLKREEDRYLDPIAHGLDEKSLWEFFRLGPNDVFW